MTEASSLKKMDLGRWWNPLERRRKTADILKTAATRGADIRVNPVGVHYPTERTIFLRTHLGMIGRNQLIQIAEATEREESKSFSEIGKLRREF